MPSADSQPVRRSSSWNGASILDLLSGRSPRFLLGPDNDELAAAARQRGWSVSPSPPPDVKLVEGEWPGIRLSSERGAADAGPTGAPWIDANYWRVQLAQTLHPGKPVWVAASPPEKLLVPSDAYVLALADAAAAGGRWIVEFTEAHAREVAGGARGLWDRIGQGLAFFDAHRDWKEFRPVAVFAVLSDFSADNEFLASEIVNLAARQHQPVHILLKREFGEASLRGLKAVVYADAETPPPSLRKPLLAFAAAGGVVIAGPSWGQVKAHEPHPHYRIERLGKGKLASASGGFDDPYLIASDAQILMSHRHDPVRFWNAGSLGSFYTASLDGRRAVLHLFNFSARRRDDSVTVWFARPYRSARWWRIEAPKPEMLETVTQGGGVELRLPPVPVYAAIELEA
jgi:hypothetical protein